MGYPQGVHPIVPWFPAFPQIRSVLGFPKWIAPRCSSVPLPTCPEAQRDSTLISWAFICFMLRGASHHFVCFFCPSPLQIIPDLLFFPSNSFPFFSWWSFENGHFPAQVWYGDQAAGHLSHGEKMSFVERYRAARRTAAKTQVVPGWVEPHGHGDGKQWNSGMSPRNVS